MTELTQATTATTDAPDTPQESAGGSEEPQPAEQHTPVGG